MPHTCRAIMTTHYVTTIKDFSLGCHNAYDDRQVMARKVINWHVSKTAFSSGPSNTWSNSVTIPLTFKPFDKNLCTTEPCLGFYDSLHTLPRFRAGARPVRCSFFAQLLWLNVTLIKEKVMFITTCTVSWRCNARKEWKKFILITDRK
jgi:hypothetical protein